MSRKDVFPPLQQCKTPTWQLGKTVVRPLVAVVTALAIAVGTLVASPMGLVVAQATSEAPQGSVVSGSKSVVRSSSEGPYVGSYAAPRSSVQRIAASARFGSRSAKLTPGSKKRIRAAVNKVNRLHAAKRSQSLVVTARVVGSCLSARVATRGEVSCAWRALAKKRAKVIKKYVRAAGFKGRVSSRYVRTKLLRAKRAVSPASSLVFTVRTATPPIPPTRTCAEGGICKIGDTGPGGGTVLYVAPSRQSWGTYIEAAPREVARDLKLWGCYGVDIQGAEGDGVGDGAANTAALLAAKDICEAQDPDGYGPHAAIAASEYMGMNGTTPGWYLPSKDELNQVCLWRSGQPTGVGTEADLCAGDRIPDPYPYSSSTQSTIYWEWGQRLGLGGQEEIHKDGTAYIWPVRAFNPAAS